ncbi:hypothetical protein B0T17DRAFT_586768 [Bombardia bombarda]|uniref:Ino eighty subunit 1 n=1 Tax=Bombardia bombarda TaxID=252184 RepID=A0AA39XJH5_9PEZI|nr:hypothetical protein B0T17DRAFT_586768 [Bombardia bombarda]
MSDFEHPSSPAGLSLHAEKSFMTVVTEDEDNTKMATQTPEPSEKHPRGKKRTRDDTKDQGGSIVGKIRHLKKEDGEPLWRKDIQYDFLKAVFDNEEQVFTNSYEPDKIGKQCFADLYIDTMSRSSKTSKVLRDKLLSDRDAAKGMAMVCLLVNIGRMNTTLNFFPEMRAQLRTYHAIPSLQAHQDPHAYKQLQDAPRLKSILKGGAEDRKEPSSLDDLKYSKVPRTNPVNLLFVICQAASKVAELHFPPGREFHDLIMKTNFTSASRARAFLWIMWFYLESDFTEEGCEENPFGAGVDYGVDVANQGVPQLVEMDEDEEAEENVDPQEEIDFGFLKQKTRAKIIEADQQFLTDSQTKGRGPRAGAAARGFPAAAASVAAAAATGDESGPTTGILPRIRPSKHDASDLDSVRSTPPPRTLARQSGAFGSTSRRGGNPLKYQIFEGSSPGGGRDGGGGGGGGSSQPIEGIVARKPRPPTAHQLAVERNRSQRVEYILDRGIRRGHHKCRKLRRSDGSIIRALSRLARVQDPFENSEDEDVIDYNRQALMAGGINGDAKSLPFREKGYGGLCQLKDEVDDFGEEFASFCAALRRSHRRLTRWENHEGDEPLGVIAPTKRLKPNEVGENGEGEGEGEGEDDYMDLDGVSPSKGGMGMSMSIDPAETEDETEAQLILSSRRRKSGRPGKTNGAARRRRMAAAAAEEEEEEDGGMNGHHRRRHDEREENLDEEVEDLDEVDRTLLGLGDGEGEGEGEGEAENEGGDEGEAEEGENEDELDEVDKTLLGMDGDSDSE